MCGATVLAGAPRGQLPLSPLSQAAAPRVRRRAGQSGWRAPRLPGTRSPGNRTPPLKVIAVWNRGHLKIAHWKLQKTLRRDRCGHITSHFWPCEHIWQLFCHSNFKPMRNACLSPGERVEPCQKEKPHFLRFECIHISMFNKASPQTFGKLRVASHKAN